MVAQGIWQMEAAYGGSQGQVDTTYNGSLGHMDKRAKWRQPREHWKMAKWRKPMHGTGKVEVAKIETEWQKSEGFLTFLTLQ